MCISSKLLKPYTIQAIESVKYLPCAHIRFAKGRCLFSSQIFSSDCVYSKGPRLYIKHALADFLAKAVLLHSQY